MGVRFVIEADSAADFQKVLQSFTDALLDPVDYAALTNQLTETKEAIVAKLEDFRAEIEGTKTELTRIGARIAELEASLAAGNMTAEEEEAALAEVKSLRAQAAGVGKPVEAA